MTTLTVQMGKYELCERLGRGGMAEVWKCVDPKLRREVAIKMLHTDLLADPDNMVRFEQEARMIASLRHPNIVQVYDFHIAPSSASDAPVAYMVMEYVEGQTLAEYINRTSRQGHFPPVGEIVSLFTSIAKAIDYAHQCGVIHRDIKPSNILLDKRNTSHTPMGEPILTDFGIAKMLGTPSGTYTRGVIGTAHYLSPEQGQGHSGNERSDLYSLGVVLYEICTGVRPFQGGNEVAILMQHISARPRPPILINPCIPPALNEVILLSLAKDPAKRFPSAAAMTVAIADACNVPVPEELISSSSPTLPLIEPADPQHFSNPPTSGRSGSLKANGHPKIAMITALSTRLTAKLAQHAPAKAPGMARPHLPGRTVMRIVLLILVLLLLVGSGLIFHSFTTSRAVGSFSFLSSEQFNGYDDHGINDEIQIDLQDIADPTPGKSYYAWLVANSNQIEAGTFPLGNVVPDHGTVDFHYTSRQHQNLLASYSALLITEENTNPAPIGPSPDPQTWRYLVQIPQTPDPNNAKHYSVLDHLRHLLAKDPDLQRVGLPGGLAIWLHQNTQEISDLAGRARDDWSSNQADDLRNQIARILDYLDGNELAQQELPVETFQSIDARDARDARIGLLDSLNNDPPGYLAHISMHLNGVIQAPGATLDMSQNAGQIDSNMNQVGQWLEQVHRDASLLVKMDDARLLSPASRAILNDLAEQAGYAYNGRFDQSNGGVQEGVRQIYGDIQRLATFDVMPYSIK